MPAVIAKDKVGNFITLGVNRSVSTGKPDDSQEVLTASLLSTLSQGNSTGQTSLPPFWNRSLTGVGSNSTGQAIADANSSQTGLGLGLGLVVVVAGLLGFGMRLYALYKRTKGSLYRLHHQEEELSVRYRPGAETSTDETVSIGRASNNDEDYLGSSSAVNAIDKKEEERVLIISIK